MEDCASLGYDGREYLFRLGRVQLGLWLVQRIGAAFCLPILSLPLARLLPFTIPTGRLFLNPSSDCVFPASSDGGLCLPSFLLSTACQHPRDHRLWL